MTATRSHRLTPAQRAALVGAVNNMGHVHAHRRTVLSLARLGLVADVRTGAGWTSSTRYAVGTITAAGRTAVAR